MNNLWISFKLASRHKKTKLNKLIQAFGQLKDDDFDFEKIERYFRNKKHVGSFQVLSDKTCNDLDFEDLFTFLDRTTSAVGQQFLYDRLRSLPQDSKHLNQQEKLVDLMIKNVDFRSYILKYLHKLHGEDSYYIRSLFQDEPLKPPKWFSIAPFLTFATVLSIIGIFINPAFIFPYLLLLITNFVLHQFNKNNVAIYLSLLPELVKMNRSARELYKNDRLKEIDPKLEKAFRYIKTVEFRLSFFDMGASLQSDIISFLYLIIEFIKVQFLLEPLMLFSLLKQLWKKKEDIEEIYSFVGQVDFLMSIAAIRMGSEKYCIPEISDKKKSLTAKNVIHPLIKNCVPNSINMNKKSVLITGSNMSGKTTFIRTIAINAITAITLNTCFADHFSLPMMKIYSAIRISDDLLNDKSYYFEEVLTIKEMILESRNDTPNLFFLDEIFKGTNTVERVSAGKAVLSWLNRADNIVFVSTHDMELTDLLNEDYELYHFSEQVNHKSVDFDYKLKAGRNENRNAIRILQINGYPESVILEALEISEKFDEIKPAKLKDIAED